MRQTFRNLLAAALVVFLLGADLSKEKAKDELRRLQGHWVLIATEFEGKRKPYQDKVNDINMSIRGCNVSYWFGKLEVAGTLRLDPSQKPKAIDETITLGASEETRRGIYELTGDSLKICLSEVGSKSRPKDFATHQGGKEVLSIYKRVKGKRGRSR